MHLNPNFRNPDVGDRFATGDVTAVATNFGEGVAAELARQLDVLVRPRPDTPTGAYCNDPRPCPFPGRCWPTDPNHIRKLYNVGAKKAGKYMASGIDTICDLPPTQRLSAAAVRQVTAMREDRVVVEHGLRDALAEFSGRRLGFLDFETIGRALPPWPGLSHWHQAAAQFSYHESRADGSYSHHEWLAEGPLRAPALHGP